MEQFSFLNNIDIDTIEKLYSEYLKKPDSVEESWRNFFKGFDFARANYNTDQGEVFDEEFKVINLIEGYRKRGHLFTTTNPVRTRRKYKPTLGISNYDLKENELKNTFQAGKRIGIGPSTLENIIDHLKSTYCGSIGCEYMFIREPEVIKWLQNKMEPRKNQPSFSVEEKKQFYEYLKKAVGFEHFIHKKFVGQKRFSLEGAEGLIPALEGIINRGADLGIEEYIIGMAHRGRLNILSNVLEKPYERIFAEFMGEEYEDNIDLGDVKYHLGYNNKVESLSGKEVRLHLVPNPSHLEMVGPVVEGIAKARIENKFDDNVNKIAPIIIHGDAAISGQGVVYETLQMSQLPAYRTGGTIHLVINNQVGFTTNYLEARSSTYCTDIAKVTKAPIFHVNGDDVEAMAYTIQLALEYRQRFHTDVFIDMLCYRKYGHNEGDEPRFTQPTLYKAISKHKNPRDIYGEQLIKEGIYSSEELKTINNDFNDFLNNKLTEAKQLEKVLIKPFFKREWKDFRHPIDDDFISSINTAIDKERFIELAKKINTLPEDKNFFKKARKLIDDRIKMLETDKFDWAMGELMAYASLLTEGHKVRITGQDAERGTFSHRHATLTIEDTDNKYTPLNYIEKDQASFDIYNSHLSEYAALGFEYGYSLVCPKGINIWEAQFGDFANVAQPIIDQYISSAEDKWGLKNGLTMLLPHGYEGQGPEHSSARIERFLVLAANNNMQIINPTTPANMFHMLRRQLKRDFQIPLVVFTPKSLLRHQKCVSSIDDFTQCGFREIIDDANVDVNQVTRVVFCTGKIYYDLLAKKEEFNARDLALVRIEQLHPFPHKQFKEVLKKYKNAIKWLWVQEEPQNMGAWQYIRNKLDKIELQPITRQESGSPAVGLHKLHQIEQDEIIYKVFRKCECELKNIYCGLQCEKGSVKTEIEKQHKYIFTEVD